MVFHGCLVSIQAERQRREIRHWEHPKRYPYPGPTIPLTRPCPPKASFGLVRIMMRIDDEQKRHWPHHCLAYPWWCPYITEDILNFRIYRFVQQWRVLFTSFDCRFLTVAPIVPDFSNGVLKPDFVLLCTRGPARAWGEGWTWPDQPVKMLPPLSRLARHNSHLFHCLGWNFILYIYHHNHHRWCLTTFKMLTHLSRIARQPKHGWFFTSGGTRVLTLLCSTVFTSDHPVLRVNNVLSIHGWSEMKTVLQEVASTREC